LGISLNSKRPTNALTVRNSRAADAARVEHPQLHLQLTPEDAQKVRIDSLPRSISFDRPRLGRKQALDLQAQKLLEDCRSEMAKILKRKKVPEDEAKSAVERTLEIATYHPLERPRRDRYLENQAEAIQGLKRLLKHVERIARAISRLTPSAQAELNRIMSWHDLRHFDTEMFAELVHTMMSATLSPDRVADEMRSAMSVASLKSSNDKCVREIRRSGPPAVLELWELMPAQTRSAVERSVRRRAPKRALAFFRHLASELKKHSPQPKRIRRPPLVRFFGHRVAVVWRKLGLHVGRAYDGEMAQHLESDFQKFCRLALTAVGDESRISGRQVDALKARRVATR
jgi:hypothetical protein